MSEKNKSQALHKSLYSAAAFKKSKITSGLTEAQNIIVPFDWYFVQ